MQHGAVSKPTLGEQQASPPSSRPGTTGARVAAMHASAPILPTPTVHAAAAFPAAAPLLPVPVSALPPIGVCAAIFKHCQQMHFQQQLQLLAAMQQSAMAHGCDPCGAWSQPLGFSEGYSQGRWGDGAERMPHKAAAGKLGSVSVLGRQGGMGMGVPGSDNVQFRGGAPLLVNPGTGVYLPQW